MKKNIVFLLVAMLIVALPIVSAFDAKTANLEDRQLYKDLRKEDPEALEVLKEKVPETYELTAESIVPVRHRYLLWTHDGQHIMWGNYGNGYFIGEDNSDKTAWGIYGKHVFAGFYDGEFFWGFYRGGKWKAYGLFGLEESNGKYILFRNRINALAAEQIE